MEILFAGLCFFIALLVGKWRSYCIFWEKNLRTNCPLGWRKSIFRLGSLLIVFFASVLFSFVGASLVTSEIYESKWWYSFLVLFIFRWLISKLLGHSKAKKEYNAFLRRVETQGN